MEYIRDYSIGKVTNFTKGNNPRIKMWTESRTGLFRTDSSAIIRRWCLLAPVPQGL